MDLEAANLNSKPGYRGRFAPTPSGPLHFGSLVAAVGSYLEARRRGGEWLLRIEDLDPPRVVAGAAEHIQRTLEAFGFEWDGPVVHQSARDGAYLEALEALRESGAVYPCHCSRKAIAEAGRIGPAGPVYPGTCRRGGGSRGRHSWRLNVEGARVRFEDAVQGPIDVDLEAELGDFVVRRADRVFAYHLALVVDDAAAAITDVVRGRDLLICTAPQILLQQRLGLPTPRYMHLPLAVNREGQKLSKQSHAPALDVRRAAEQLAQALGFLGHRPPDEVHGDVRAVWVWALEHWDAGRIPRQAEIQEP